MKRFRRLPSPAKRSRYGSRAVAGLVCLLCCSTPLTATTLQDDIDIAADRYEYDRQADIVVGRGNVVISYQDLLLHADQVTVNRGTGDVEATGNVHLTRGEGASWSGSSVTGNIRSKTFNIPDQQAQFGPWHMSGAAAERQADGDLVANDCAVSTCDHLEHGAAHWRLDAERLVYHPDGRFTAHNVIYRIGDVPVFYLPVAWGSTDTRIGSFEVRPGYKSDWGAFVDLSRTFQLSQTAKTRLSVGYRVKRGFSAASETNIATENSATELFLFGMRDEEPPSDRRVSGALFDGRFRSEEGRGRVRAAHRSDLTDQLILRLNADYRSDRQLLAEFFRNEFRVAPEPTSMADFGYYGENLELALNIRPRLNDFESVVERLPELRLTLPRQAISGLPLDYAGETTWSQLRNAWRQFDTPGLQLDNQIYGTDRFDSLHFLYLPWRLDHLTLMPRAGVRLTHYGDSSAAPVTAAQLNRNFRADDPTGDPTNSAATVPYDGDGGGRNRVAYELGLELSSKLVRRWADGRRHVLEPYLNYTYLPEPSIENDYLYFFDEIDRLAYANFIRFGIYQQLLADRAPGRRQLMDLDTFYDLHVNPRPQDGEAGDLGAVLRLNPNDDFSGWAEVLVDSGQGRANVVNLGTRITNFKPFAFDLEYLYREDFTARYNYSMSGQQRRVFTMDTFPVSYELNHNLRFGVGLPLGDKTALDASLYFDLDEESLERQSYELRRDLHCWASALRLERDHHETSVFLLLYLKAFPTVRLRAGI